MANPVPPPGPREFPGDPRPRPRRSWWLILTSTLALLLGITGFLLALVPCVTVLSLYASVPALALGLIATLICLWRGYRKWLALLATAVAALAFLVGYSTFVTVTRTKPSFREMLEIADAGTWPSTTGAASSTNAVSAP